MNLRKFFLNRQHSSSRSRSAEVTIPVLILATVLGLTVVSLAWLAYRASQEWRRSAMMVVERRVDEVATLLTTALIRDMRGVHESILTPLTADQLSPESMFEITDSVSRAFSRFPYPESFFVWRSGQNTTGSAVLFNRSDRPPTWEPETTTFTTFPVTIDRNSSMAEDLVHRVKAYATPRGELASFETSIGEIPYQVIARVFFRANSKNEAFAIVGFTVNLDWVGAKYFSELTDQIERIDGKLEASSLSLSIVDDKGRIVTQTRPPKGDAPVRETEFPLAFFDSLSAPGASLVDMPVRQWTARVGTADDPLLAAADTGARRTLVLIVFAAAASAVSLLLAFRSLLTNFDLVAMKADFVSMVSHELKTPLASLHLVGETLSKGRYSSEQAIAEYGALVSKETARLTRLIENVLTFSRVTDSKSAYKMAKVDVGETVNEIVARLQPQIDERSIDLSLHLSSPSINIVCDREAIINVFENLIVNAIKYSDQCGKVEIRAFQNSNFVNFSVADYGRGIPAEDLPYVFDKFYRGRNSGFTGSGLGLAIAHRIIKDHGGNISINSVAGAHTVITVALPAMEAAA